ncbi:MAG: hypothetical protein R2745_26285 [Vicinamibacterales bacterium]
MSHPRSPSAHASGSPAARLPLAEGGALAPDPVSVPAAATTLAADLRVPVRPRGLVIVPLGGGTSRFGRRSQRIAARLGGRRFATLLLDLLTAEEEAIDVYTAEFRFDVGRLGPRAVAAVEWARRQPSLAHLAIGLLGMQAAAPAALLAASDRPRDVGAVVVVPAGRTSWVEGGIRDVAAPTLLVVPDRRAPGSGPAAAAGWRFLGPLDVAVPPARPGAAGVREPQDRLADLAAAWFERHLAHAMGSGV